MFFYSSLKKEHAISALTGICFCLTSLSSIAAGGISLQSTRIVYPQNEHQQSISVSNRTTDESFLIQSWVEDDSGHKSPDFIVTPPLYLSAPGNENTLRIMLATAAQQPTDRETLYWFVARAIPPVNKTGDKSSELRLALASRIKLFLRPPGLKADINNAPNMLSFHRVGAQLEITNTSPYFQTLTGMKAGYKNLDDIMVPPKGHARVPLPAGSGSTVTYQTISDYGSPTMRLNRPIN